LLESLTELEAAQTELQNLKEMITINDQELSSVKQQLADATQQTENFVTVVNEKTVSMITKCCYYCCCCSCFLYSFILCTLNFKML